MDDAGSRGGPYAIYDAAMEFQRRGTPLARHRRQEYGTGSSRDWAAKGTLLLGVRAVIAESFERIHGQIVGMGVIPLESWRRVPAVVGTDWLRDVCHRG